MTGARPTQRSLHAQRGTLPRRYALMEPFAVYHPVVKCLVARAMPTYARKVVVPGQVLDREYLPD